MNCQCRDGWTCSPNLGARKCYKFIEEPKLSWSDASKKCQEIAPRNQYPEFPIIRRHLASIGNGYENSFVVELTGGVKAWLGGTRLADGNWSWTDGTKWNYTNWRQEPIKEPNNYRGQENSLVLWWPGGSVWNDASYSNKYSYVCQYLDLNQFDSLNNK